MISVVSEQVRAEAERAKRKGRSGRSGTVFASTVSGRARVKEENERGGKRETSGDCVVPRRE